MSETCLICLQSLSQGGRQTLACTHVFHEACILSMRRFGSSARCPLCRDYQEDLKPVSELLQKAERCFSNHDYTGCFKHAMAVRDIDFENEIACVLLADLHFDGKGRAQDIEAAMECYEAASRHGNFHAIVNLAHIHQEKGNNQKALQLYESVQQRGDPIVNYNLGILYKDRGNPLKAMECWELASQAGDVDAKFMLCTLYTMLGKKCEDDQISDIDDRFGELHNMDFLERTLEGMNKDGVLSYNLAVRKRDAGYLREAERLFLKAAGRGNRDAAYNLGCMYKRENRRVEALHYYGVASDMGSDKATFTLALMHKAEGNIARAISLCELAMEQGSVDAISTLGTMYEKQGNLTKAKHCYEIAACKGCPYGNLNLGILQEKHGNLQDAVSNFGAAASAGNHYASVRLAALSMGLSMRDLFGIGDRVLVHSLVSEQGQLFNSKQGTIVDLGNDGRCSVLVDGYSEVKPISYMNLKHAFCKGDHVSIQGLKSIQGQPLNGMQGKLVDMTDSGRWKVKIDGLKGTKAIKEENLTCTEKARQDESASRSSNSSVPVTPAMSKTPGRDSPKIDDSKSPSSIGDPSTLDDDELAVQNALLESCHQDQAPSSINSQVSSDLLRNRCILKETAVCLHYSRCPRSFKHALESCPVLMAWQRPLAAMARKCDAELCRPGKIFVKPEHYKAVLEAIHEQGLRLTASHIVAERQLEEHILQLVSELAPKEQVHLKSIASIDLPTPVTRTFIHFSIPASSSSGLSLHAKTVSTTDTDARKGKNPRC